jgi:putative ABC transport system permease protein
MLAGNEHDGRASRINARDRWRLRRRRLTSIARLAFRNLFHDRTSLAVTLTGIVFAVVLLFGQCGLYLASERMISAMHDRYKADLWVLAEGTESFDDAALLDDRRRFATLSVPGIKSVSELTTGYAAWRRPTGGWMAVFVVGSNRLTLNGGTGAFVEGNDIAVQAPQAVSVDKTYLGDLGIKGLGSSAEINETRVSVGALSDGLRAFTTVPYVFTTLDRARTLLDAGRDQSSFQLIDLQPGADLEMVRTAIQKRVEGVEVLTHQEFRNRSLDYWLFETGAGTSLIAGAFLGLVIGIVVVAQSLYSSAKDHLNEFATLRALGASTGYIHAVILLQAILCALLGFFIGFAITLAVVRATAGTALSIVVTPELAAAMFVMTLVMCTLAALGAISKITRIDPASVFNR